MASNDFKTTKKVILIDEVMPNPWNPNVQDKGLYEKNKKQIEALGFFGSIIAREYFGRYQILDGEHRWKIAKELGYTEIPVEIVVGPMSDSQAKFHTVNFNNSRGKDDIFKRAQIFQEMDAGQQELLPFSAEEIENEKQLITFDFAQYDKESDLPQRSPGMLVVLPFNAEESHVWMKVKADLVEKGLIGTDNTKKKQDIQTIMYLAKNILGITMGSNGNTAFEIPIDPTVVPNSVNTDSL